MRISDWSSDVCSSDLKTSQPFQSNGQTRAPTSTIGVKKPTKVKPVHSANTSHIKCSDPLRRTFSRVHGPASSFMHLARSHPAQRSIPQNPSVHTVRGQTKPPHTRPSNARETQR